MLTGPRFKQTLDLLNATLATLKRPGTITPQRMQEEITLLTQSLSTALIVLDDRDVQRALTINHVTIRTHLGSALGNLAGFDINNERDVRLYSRYKARLIAAIEQTLSTVRMPHEPSMLARYAAKAVCIIALGVAGMGITGCDNSPSKPYTSHAHTPRIFSGPVTEFSYENHILSFYVAQYKDENGHQMWSVPNVRAYCTAYVIDDKEGEQLIQILTKETDKFEMRNGRFHYLKKGSNRQWIEDFPMILGDGPPGSNRENPGTIQVRQIKIGNRVWSFPAKLPILPAEDPTQK